MSIVRHDTNTRRKLVLLLGHTGDRAPHLLTRAKAQSGLGGIEDMASLSHAGAPDVEASNVEERGKGGGMGSSTDYESSDEEWRSPFIDAETGESCFDEETGTFPYGTLSKTASKISSPDGVTRRFLEMLRYSDKDFPCEVPSLFIDIGCGRGQVVNRVASELKCKCVLVFFVAVPWRMMDIRTLRACQVLGQKLPLGCSQFSVLAWGRRPKAPHIKNRGRALMA